MNCINCACDTRTRDTNKTMLFSSFLRNCCGNTSKSRLGIQCSNPAHCLNPKSCRGSGQTERRLSACAYTYTITSYETALAIPWNSCHFSWGKLPCCYEFMSVSHDCIYTVSGGAAIYLCLCFPEVKLFSQKGEINGCLEIINHQIYHKLCDIWYYRC